MAAIQTIIETIFGYPATALIKDFKAMRAEHKLYRNIWRIALGGIGAAVGGVIPSLVDESISHYVANIVQTVFPISSVPSYVTGNLFLVYLGLTSGLLVGKLSAQAYYYLVYQDSNSAHLLYDFERRHISRLYASLQQNGQAIEAKVEAIFEHLVGQIRQAKSPHQGTPLEPITLAWSKSQLKGVLNEFVTGNSDPYNFYHRMAHLKENFVGARIAERLEEIDTVLRASAPITALSFQAPTSHTRRATEDLPLHESKWG
jgi:hypothetical protein